MSIADGCADLYSKNLIKCIETRERIGIGMVVENKRSWGLVAGSVETGPETVVIIRMEKERSARFIGTSGRRFVTVRCRKNSCSVRLPGIL